MKPLIAKADGATEKPPNHRDQTGTRDLVDCGALILKLSTWMGYIPSLHAWGCTANQKQACDSSRPASTQSPNASINTTDSFQYFLCMDWYTAFKLCKLLLHTKRNVSNVVMEKRADTQRNTMLAKCGMWVQSLLTLGTPCQKGRKKKPQGFYMLEWQPWQLDSGGHITPSINSSSRVYVLCQVLNVNEKVKRASP